MKLICQNVTKGEASLLETTRLRIMAYDQNYDCEKSYILLNILNFFKHIHGCKVVSGNVMKFLESNVS